MPLVPGLAPLGVELCPLTKEDFAEGLIMVAWIYLIDVHVSCVIWVWIYLWDATAVAMRSFELKMLSFWPFIDVEQYGHFIPKLWRNQRRRRVRALLLCKHLILLFFEEVQILNLQILWTLTSLLASSIQPIKLVLNLYVGFDPRVLNIGYHTALIKVYLQRFNKKLLLIFLVTWSQRFEYHLLIFHLLFGILFWLLPILILRHTLWFVYPSWRNFIAAAALAWITTEWLVVGMVSLYNLLGAVLCEMYELRQLSYSVQWKLAFHVRFASFCELLGWQTVILFFGVHGSLVIEPFWIVVLLVDGFGDLASGGILSWCEVILGRDWCLCGYRICPGLSTIKLFIIHKHEIHIRLLVTSAASTSWSVIRCRS